MEIFYAKSNSLNGPVTNREHLTRVAELAGTFGQEIGRELEASAAGQLHDFGKNSTRFAGVLNGTNHHVDHALPGAAFLYARFPPDQRSGPAFAPLIESIQGHHDGLVSLNSLSSSLRVTWNDPQADCCPSGKVPSLRGHDEFLTAWQAFRADFPSWKMPRLPKRCPQNNVEDMLDTRMLFSCLVDADYCVSALDNDPDYLKKSAGAPLDADAALYTLDAYCAGLRASSQADSALNRIRTEVYDACGKAGQQPCGLFTLTAPTGVGKTLAMLHFALHHCKENGLRRIIVVLPFLTLAEQSEKEYANILPDLLVDHSQKSLPDSARELAARWDAPMVLTTSVRFFESLFADQPTDCRKLHNIANSVVLFDEAQSLPADLAPATVQAVNTLCRKYHCSMVFSTATQPDFSALPGARWTPREILPDNAVLYQTMRRVHVEWRLFKNTGRSQNPSLADIAAEMAGQASVCAIVNLRRHAQTLFAALRSLCPEGEVFLLTTDLCPAHRLAVVEEIKQRLKDKKPCRVVATQCIEAGVDLDFDRMYRALAPLEAVIQAAGRCNRNGRCPQGGQVVVFEPGESGRLYPGDSYERAAQIVKGLWAENPALDINSPALTQEYYRRFFRTAAGKSSLQKALESKNYHDTAKEYRLITTTGVQVIVPWQGAADLFRQVREEAAATGLTSALLRKAAPITVSCFDRNWVEQHAEPLCFASSRHCTESGFYILNAGQEHCYDNATGLTLTSSLPEDFMV